MNKIIPYVLIVIFFASNRLLAQFDKYSHSSSWNTMTIKSHLNDKTFVKNELNFRRTNFLKDWEQIVIRPSVQYQLNQSITIAIGYTYIKNYSYSAFSSPIDTKENNLWQQLFIKHSFNEFHFSHRIRFEERFQEQVSQVDSVSFNTDNIYAGRLRYRFIVSAPILKKQHVSIIAYDEVFLDFEKGLLPKKLNQNWVFIGLRFRESEHITITSGYHNINIPRQNFSITNHVWETSLIYTL
ncbi:hypothetical protein BBFL7_00998 [Flavobacteria bacterium BBFL7]|nr:hypothetical protein BBFL7_00998 [Flavobacteria bacterium BBFL7]